MVYLTVNSIKYENLRRIVNLILTQIALLILLATEYDISSQHWCFIHLFENYTKFCFLFKGIYSLIMSYPLCRFTRIRSISNEYFRCNTIHMTEIFHSFQCYFVNGIGLLVDSWIIFCWFIPTNRWNIRHNLKYLTGTWPQAFDNSLSHTYIEV